MERGWNRIIRGEACVRACLVAQSCPTLCDPVDCSPPGSSAHGILQARILEGVAISFSRGSSRPRDPTQVSCIAGRHFNLWATREAQGNAKECSNYLAIALISHTSKVMLKILQARLQQYVSRELSDVQAGFRKGRWTRDQIANIHWIIKKAREFQKTSISVLLTMPKPLTVWITINCGKFWKRWEYQTTWPASWETYMQVRKQQLALDMEQETGSK